MPPSSPAPHALLVTGQSASHINACMLLARSLSSHGFSVSFVFFSSLYSDLQRKKRLPSTHNSNIRIHVLPDGLESDRPQPLAIAPTTTMREGLEQLVEKQNQEQNPVTCIVSDLNVHWTQDVADKFAIPRIDYCTSRAMAYLMLMNMGSLYSDGYLPEKDTAAPWKREKPIMVDCIPGLPPYPLDFYPKELRCLETSHPLVRYFLDLASRMKAAERVLIHTVHELETAAIEAFSKVEIPAYAVGPLYPHASSQNDDSPDEEESLKWLDTQADSSVLYVAFGTVASFSSEETCELACGLEASGQPFLWVIRADANKGSSVLPEGFKERTKGQGLTVSWAPQVKVLKHAAVGGFLTHCGWNSTMESLWEGVPMLGCPRGAEQRVNVYSIAEEWKVGFEVERTEDGGLTREGVEKGVRTLMQEMEGDKARSRAQEIKQVVRKTSEENGISNDNLKKFYEDMKSRISF